MYFRSFGVLREVKNNLNELTMKFTIPLHSLRQLCLQHVCNNVYFCAG